MEITTKKEKYKYVVRLKWPASCISNKFGTSNQDAAIGYFRKLIARRDLRGEKVTAEFRVDGRCRYSHNFMASPGEADYIDPDADLKL